jgi:hypothetical protein
MANETVFVMVEDLLEFQFLSPLITVLQIVQAKQSKIPVKATPTTMNKMKRPDAQRRWQAEDEEESSDSFISDEDEADTRGYSGVSSMIREMFRYSYKIPKCSV